MTTIASSTQTTIARGVRYFHAAAPIAAWPQQHQEDLVGRVRRRRDRVGGEHRQRDRLAQALVVLFVRTERAAEEDAFDGHGGLPVGGWASTGRRPVGTEQHGDHEQGGHRPEFDAVVR